MGKRDDPWKRLREREDEADGNRPQSLRDQARAQAQVDAKVGKSDDSLESAGFLDLVREIEPLIEQINSLMRQYVLGVEQRPPIEKRQYLERLMRKLVGIPKATPSQRFKASALQVHYASYNDRWEKMSRDLESGKIKRIVKTPPRGPRRA